MVSQPPSDIWRDSFVRYLGYSNELGESFRPILPRLVIPSYIVAFGYVLGDTYDKTRKAKIHAKASNMSTKEKSTAMIVASIDTLLWQTAASVVLPGFTINRVVAASSFLANKTLHESPVLRRWTPTAIGLSVIPFIIHPIDHLVDICMDNTIRKWFEISK